MLIPFGGGMVHVSFAPNPRRCNYVPEPGDDFGCWHTCRNPLHCWTVGRTAPRDFVENKRKRKRRQSVGGKGKGR